MTGTTASDHNMRYYGPAQFTEADVLAFMSESKEGVIKQEVSSPKSDKVEDEEDQKENSDNDINILKEKLKKLEDTSKCSKCTVRNTYIFLSPVWVVT